MILADDLTVERAKALAGCIVIMDGHTYVDWARLADMLEEVGK